MNLMRGSKEIVRGGSHNVFFIFFYDTDLQRDLQREAIGPLMGPLLLSVIQYHNLEGNL